MTRHNHPKTTNKHVKTSPINKKHKTIVRNHVHHTSKIRKKIPRNPKNQRQTRRPKMKNNQIEQAGVTSTVSEKLQDNLFSQHIDTKAGSKSSDILRILSKNQKSDEDIATQLNMKVNDVRRSLNIMNSYSIVKYDVRKDNKGWLMFIWKINGEKLNDYISNINKNMTETTEPEFPTNCNDFFICKKCYNNQKIVLPFESAFDSNFNCDGCGKPYTILNRIVATELFKNSQIN